MRRTLMQTGTLSAPTTLPSKIGLEALMSKTAAPLGVFHNDLSGRHFSSCRILVVGDSNGEGAGATVDIRNRWIDRLQALLRAKFPTDGNPGATLSYVPAYNVVNMPSDMAVRSAGVTTGTSFGFGAKHAQLTATGHTVTFTVTGTSAKVVYPKSSTGGSFTWQVDGGTVSSPIAQTNGSLQDGFTTDITLGASGSHTVVIAWASGSSVYVDGLLVYNGDETKGIRVIDGSHSGWGAQNYQLNGIQFYQGSLTTMLAPALVIIALGINDFAFGSLSIANYKIHMQANIDRYRGAIPTKPPSILLLAAHRRSPVTAVATWAEYVQAMKELAQANDGVAFLDLSTRLPQVSGDTRGLYADEVHLSNKGHSAVADYVAGFISPS